MAANIEEELIEKLRALPPERQQQALEYINALMSEANPKTRPSDKTKKTIWEVAQDINAKLPQDTWDAVPTDGSINLDHYLYGAPKRQP